MARLHRSCPPGYTQHVIQRGNNRAPCFGDNADRYQYMEWLTEYAQEFAVAVHAWVLMTNHVHLLATPSTEGGLSRLMQFLGRRYVRYFNKTCQRTGTLWEGRFKSCVVQGVHYALRRDVYIEMNPVRAGMVSRPGEYQHSSYRCHAAGRKFHRTPISPARRPLYCRQADGGQCAPLEFMTPNVVRPLAR